MTKARVSWVTILLLGAILLCAAAASAREIIGLDGMWEYVYADVGAPPGPDTTWQPVQVPSTLPWRPDGPHCVWYRRSFYLPDTWAGQRVVLRLEAVKYSHRARLNGREAGRHTGGYEPVEYDVTQYALPGQRNDLLVAAEDWTSLIAPGTAQPATPFAEFASWVKDGILAPIGSRGDELGIWQSVSVEARPRVWVDDAFVMTSVRERNLRVEVTLRNAGPRPEEAAVSASVTGGGPGPELPPQRVVVPAGQKVTTVLEAPWAEPRLWSPEDPHLYSLLVTAGQDAKEVRFGFREFWVEGGRFFLNGRPLHLLATAVHPMNEYSSDPKRAYQIARSAGCVAMRLHAQPWEKQWYDAADEAGMLLIWESAAWCLSPNYGLSRDEFWGNFREHLAAQIRQHRNHPSVVIWSAENELLLCGGDAVAGTEERLGGIADFIRGLDPTRPVMFDGDEDPAGKADVVNLHYPREFPKWNLWPETAYWFDQTITPDTYPGREWRWDRKKPLYLGEFLWVPGGETDAASIFFGDAIYPDTAAHHRKAKAEAWQMQIIAARDAGVSGLCPWNLWEMGDFPNVGYEAHKRAYQPVAAFVKEAGTRAFSEGNVERTLVVLNDSGTARSLEVRWRLAAADDSWETKGSQPVRLETAGRTRISAKVMVPAIPAVSAPARFTVEVWDGERRLFSESQDWKVYSRAALSGAVAGVPRRLAVYDPKGATTGLLSQLGVDCFPLGPANAEQVLSEVPVAVVGKGALARQAGGRVVVGRPDSFYSQLLRFVRAGGVLLVFEQDEYPSSLIPLALSDHGSTISFPRDCSHPIVAGLDADDLSHWLPDGIVGRHEIVKPNGGGFLPLVDSGGPRGLETAGLAEVRVGKGRMVLCQLEVTAKFGEDPVATVLVRNMLADASRRPEPPAPTGVACGDATAVKLSAIGLRYERIPDPLRAADLARYGQLLLCDLGEAASAAEQLRGFVQRGGRVVLHGLTSGDSGSAYRLLGEKPTVYEGCDGWVRLSDRSGPAAGISNQELAWFGSQPQASYASRSISPDIASHLLAKPYQQAGRESRVEAETMRVTGTSPGQERVGEDTVLTIWSNAVLATGLSIPEAGRYVLNIRARGTPAAGAYPRLTIVVDDLPVGSVATAAQWRTLTSPVTFPAGEHTLKLVFANDLVAGTEDRNLWVDWVSWAPIRLSPTKLTFHTEPGVLASLADGKGLWVIDQVRWEQMGENDDRAGRYLSMLLTNLGCEFEPEAGEAIEASQMEVKEAAIFNRTPEGIALASAGVVEAEVEFTRGGEYAFSILASGTAVDGIYPRVELRVDGQAVGAVDLQAQGWRTYRLTVPVEAGVHRVGLAFVNDTWKPPEDRNLNIGRLIISEAARP